MTAGEEMDRMGILDNTESLFEKVGFHLSERCCVRPSCFDFAARREDSLVFVKATSNIANIYEKDACELKALAEFLSGTALFVCERTRSKPLEDDTVYSRYRVEAITPETLGNSLLRGMNPLIKAGPGGYYVSLDWEAIRRKRLEKGLSMGKMAEIMGVSRRTLYGYERGLAKASVSTAYKLDWVWGIPVVKPIDIFQNSQKTESILATARRIISESRFMQFVIKKLLQFNFVVLQLDRAPFDFIARSPDAKTSLLGAMASGEETDLKARTEEIVSVSKLVEAQPIFVTDHDGAPVDGVPTIRLEDLEKIRCEEDLIAKL